MVPTVSWQARPWRRTDRTDSRWNIATFRRRRLASNDLIERIDGGGVLLPQHLFGSSARPYLASNCAARLGLAFRYADAAPGTWILSLRRR